MPISNWCSELLSTLVEVGVVGEFFFNLLTINCHHKTIIYEKMWDLLDQETETPRQDGQDGQDGQESKKADTEYCS